MSNTRLQLQIDQVEKSIDHKTHKGISFAILANNNVEYVNIPTGIEQRFVYLHNPSKLSREERSKINASQITNKSKATTTWEALLAWQNQQTKK